MDCMKNGCSIERAGKNEFLVESLSWKRFYECIFCKRGFANAQALGGHMNIHRKDRQQNGSAASKQVHVTSSSSSRPHVVASKSARETNTCPRKYLERFFDVQCLSLKIESGLEEDVDLGGTFKHEDYEEHEIDLELRLGYC